MLSMGKFYVLWQQRYIEVGALKRSIKKSLLKNNASSLTLINEKFVWAWKPTLLFQTESKCLKTRPKLIATYIGRLSECKFVTEKRRYFSPCISIASCVAVPLPSFLPPQPTTPPPPPQYWSLIQMFICQLTTQATICRQKLFSSILSARTQV